MPCTKLAELLDVAPQQLSRWRRSEDLKVSVALKVAAVFGLTLDELLKHGIE
jgi:transcriptional regulator with XRE-family HTH domain